MDSIGSGINLIFLYLTWNRIKLLNLSQFWSIPLILSPLPCVMTHSPHLSCLHSCLASTHQLHSLSAPVLRRLIAASFAPLRWWFISQAAWIGQSSLFLFFPRLTSNLLLCVTGLLPACFSPLQPHHRPAWTAIQPCASVSHLTTISCWPVMNPLNLHLPLVFLWTYLYHTTQTYLTVGYYKYKCTVK